MEMKLRKLWPLVGAMCATVFSSAFAHSNYNGGSDGSSYGSGFSMDSRSGMDSNSMQSGQGTYQRGTFREITPNAGPRVAHGADVFITADFIWWNVNQDGLDYAFTGVQPGLVNRGAMAFTNAESGRVATLGDTWEPGFQAGLGLNLGHDGWDIYAQYTWLNASSSNSISNATNGVVLNKPTPVSARSSRIGGQNVTSNWDLRFSVIDLEIGRNFYLSQFLTMRPFMGFKGTWQDQCWKVTADNNVSFGFLAAAGATPGSVQQSFSTDVWGIGVRGGFNLGWYMSKNWSLFANLAWSAMWSDYHKLNREDTYTDNNGASTTLFKVENNTYYTVKYIGESELGIRWETWFYDDNYHFAVQAGWEQQAWINWGYFAGILEHDANDLSLYGLNLKFRFDF